MTQEERELLLKDLCARLPYGVKIEYIKTKKQYRLHELSEDGDYFSLLHETEPTGVCSELGIEYGGKQTIKPYLRPISSITEEEERELNGLLPEVYDFTFRMDELLELIQTQKEIPFHYIDWFNEHHFDYRGFIEMGLALEAPKDMYRIKSSY